MIQGSTPIILKVLDKLGIMVEVYEKKHIFFRRSSLEKPTVLSEMF